MAILEIRDLDALTTTVKVLAAMQREAIELNLDTFIRLTEANSRKEKRVFVSTSANCAKVLLKLQKIKIDRQAAE